jgi:hypothetical protein
VKYRVATTLLVVTALIVAAGATARPAVAAGGGPWPIDTYGIPRTTDNVILKWDEQLLNVIRAYPAQTGPTITARALGVLHTATYDAWAAYDPKAVGTRPDGPPKQNSNDLADKNKAISFAAYRVLVDLFPTDTFPAIPATSSDPGYSTPDVLMTSPIPAGLAYDPDEVDTSTPEIIDTPAEVGTAAAQAVLSFRHSDGSNQLNGYADPSCVPVKSASCYQAKNTWDNVAVPWHWQPLCVPLASAGPTGCGGKVQEPLTPQWKNVTPFGPLNAKHYPDQFSLAGPPKLADGSYDPADIDTALSDSSNLSDAAKVKAEYWADGPKSEFPPGHMADFAQALSRMRQNTLDQDAKLFFVLGNALLDSSISAWASKYEYDFWRPTTAIRVRYKDKLVTSWLGPKKGYGKVLGQNWMPYQPLNVVTPAFPEYVSGHSTFSAAGRTVLAAFYGTETFGARVTIKAGSSKIEPGVTPAKDVVLSWRTLSDAADEAGMSRRYGGIHFYNGDQQGRVLGRLIGYNDWNLAQTYFNPTS